MKLQMEEWSFLCFFIIVLMPKKDQIRHYKLTRKTKKEHSLCLVGA